MRFKVNRVALVKEIGQLGLDVFLGEFDKFCVNNFAATSNAKWDMSLLRALCNTIENAYEKKHTADEKLDKRKTVIDQYIKLKSANKVLFTPEDRIVLEQMVEDLHNSGAIKKIGLLKLWSKRLKRFLLGTK